MKICIDLNILLQCLIDFDAARNFEKSPKQGTKKKFLVLFCSICIGFLGR